jgi:hypothetical protein
MLALLLLKGIERGRNAYFDGEYGVGGSQLMR